MKEIKPTELPFSVFELKNKWMLITAEKGGKINTMTASWGGLGVMWNKEVAYVVIRPQRYTREFVDYSDRFSLCFFSDIYKKQLNYLGSVSGRDENKIEKARLTVDSIDNVPYFKDAENIIICKKIFIQAFEGSAFLDKSLIKKWYDDDYHILYIAEITHVFDNK